MSFTSLGLKQPILLGVEAAGYEAPTPIQAQAIPLARSGRDIVGLGQTGSGKTAAYGLPMLDRLVGGQPGLRGLILVPTRELCVQVAENLRVFAQFSGLHVRTAFGGIPLGVQEAAIKRGLDVLVACPGRLLDHLQFNTVTLDRIEMLVLDEADRMLDMGFMPQIGRILSRMPRERQNMLFSATMPSDIERLVRDHFGEFQRIQVGELSQAATTITHRFESVAATEKERRLEQILRSRSGTVLVFVKTKKRCEELGRKLQRAGLPADSIHGDKSAESRHVVLQGFIRGKVRHLVATDVAARGIDVSDIGLVVNFEMPRAVEDYVHRVGRTGRAGTEGEALSLVGKMEQGIQRQVLEHLAKTSTNARIEVDGRVVSGGRPKERAPRVEAADPVREAEAGDGEERAPERPRGRGRERDRGTVSDERARPRETRSPRETAPPRPPVRRAADRAVTLSSAPSSPRESGFGDGIEGPAPGRGRPGAGGSGPRRR
ncbi:MAG: DEAD/DEAH box helicase [Planctomycetes bacterium]|nr:DEAD/DEAH box helicase [Planctomycetota bacterium]